MKRAIAALSVLVAMIAGCSNVQPSTDGLQASETQSEPNGSDENKFLVINNFISAYNKTAAYPISSPCEMDLHGEDYRTEFRLGAFKNAVGQKGTVSGFEFEVVNYGSNGNKSLRIYTTVKSREMANQIIFDVVRILDSSVSESKIRGETSKQYCRFLLGESNQIQGYINQNYSANGYDVFVDCATIKFVG